ncbi:glucose sorbosone dehydrogenase [Runella rosea]|uniref:Glucose sorbosone dehydrogenase n=2 Tax=Runella rosea TaxID=2259595 RepID=A0A344TEM4_9BACT|nr:glucose sorbosone dehydrogenase [Runella rosea]
MIMSSFKHKATTVLILVAAVGIASLVLLMYQLNEKKYVKNLIPGATNILENAFPNLSFNEPVEFTHAGDSTNRVFVVEQSGRIKVFNNNVATKSSEVYLDIRDRVSDGGEMGLLGLAFDPNFTKNGYFYVNYTQRKPLQTIIARYQATSYKDIKVDASTEVILLKFTQPYDNHNGGKMAFGPDGFLYISTGDGGAWGDQHNYAQNRQSLLGKILRIDVGKMDKGNYGIPTDNPYAANTLGYREEIYAYGLRNPWRFSFDAQTGQLWAGDVGQNEFEEIDIITKGGNYGWRLKEGNRCYNPRKDCDPADSLINPIHQYPRSDGTSVTGGVVYRGKRLPALRGKYLFADYSNGNIWTLTFKENTKTSHELLTANGGSVSAFGEDANHEIYVLDHYKGQIKRFVSSK